MKLNWRQVLRWGGYPLFYVLAFVLFARWAFPYERVRDLAVQRFAESQGSEWVLEIEELGPYWFSGLEAEGITLTAAPTGSETSESGIGASQNLKLESLVASTSLISVLMGDQDVAFELNGLGGTASGDWQEAGDSQELTLELTGLEVAQLPLSMVESLRDSIGALPLEGQMGGSISLKLPGKLWSKAEGQIALSITDFKVGDGKSKIKDIALPRIQAGEFQLKADVVEGTMTVETFETKGVDLELSIDGDLKFREPLSASRFDLRSKFRFTDAYKNKDDMTKTLFIPPTPKASSLFDLVVPKRAKGSEGYYGWRIGGTFGKPRITPSKPRDTSGKRSKKKRSKRLPRTAPTGKAKR